MSAGNFLLHPQEMPSSGCCMGYVQGSTSEHAFGNRGITRRQLWGGASSIKRGICQDIRWNLPAPDGQQSSRLLSGGNGWPETMRRHEPPLFCRRHLSAGENSTYCRPSATDPEKGEPSAPKDSTPPPLAGRRPPNECRPTLGPDL